MFILQWTVSSMKTRTVIVLFNSTHSLLTNTSLSEGLENIFERIDFINFINYAKVMYQKYLPITRILRARMPHFLWLEVKEERGGGGGLKMETMHYLFFHKLGDLYLC